MLPADFAAILLRDTPEAVVYADADGTIQFWNQAAERIFGYSAAEAIGQSLDLIVPANLRDRHWQGYRQTMATGESRYGAGDLLAVPAQKKDGSRVSIEFTIIPFREPDGRLCGIAAFLRDVTRRFEEVRALRKELADARVAVTGRPA